MDHETIKDNLLTFRDAELPSAQRQEIQAHLQACEDCKNILARWDVAAAEFKQTSLLPASGVFVNNVMGRLAALEKEMPSPAPRRWSFVNWLLPLLGYGLAFFLIFLAISARETSVNTGTVLLADVPQTSQWTFSSEAPDMDQLLGIQKGEI